VIKNTANFSLKNIMRLLWKLSYRWEDNIKTDLEVNSLQGSTVHLYANDDDDDWIL
jgi:hypothetical protein